MEERFDSKEYIKILGEELVNDFIKAGKTTHTCAVGSGREKALMNKLIRDQLIYSNYFFIF